MGALATNIISTVLISSVVGSFGNYCNTCHKTTRPTFVSGWILMRAQDSQHFEKTVVHGLGILPYKVDVQIRPTSGPNAGWIFRGDGAYQVDDDEQGGTYGGIVYFYDETTVYLNAPMKNNNNNAGVVVNTGQNKNRRLGNNHQTAVEAYVRVRVWAPCSLPRPDVISNWLPLNIRSQTTVFHEILHGLRDYPGLLIAQIRCNSTENSRIMISEGVGAGLQNTRYLNSGGVVYAFNDTAVRIWTAFNPDETYYYGELFGYPDGWGAISMDGMDTSAGEVRVLVWDRYRISSGCEELEKHEDNTDFADWTPFADFSPDDDLFNLYVQANDGPNAGFRFPGYGNSQAPPSKFGGAVYAYHPNGNVRIWRPNPSMGSLINVNSPYGNGANVQESNNAKYVSSLIRSKSN